MPTYVYDKKRFLDFLGTLQDDDIILLTNEIDGNLTASPKKNKQRISFAYAGNAFANSGDVRHWALGETPAWSFTVCKAKDISEDARKVL